MKLERREGVVGVEEKEKQKKKQKPLQVLEVLLSLEPTVA